ncbi:hypothetical protein EV127DRAFT_484294 [Xylaria flabelliformis]|nr:hypothetical protein EV127DRAFT_484294 [Xylaria flabelliformis]
MSYDNSSEDLEPKVTDILHLDVDTDPTSPTPKRRKTTFMGSVHIKNIGRGGNLPRHDEEVIGGGGGSSGGDGGDNRALAQAAGAGALALPASVSLRQPREGEASRVSEVAQYFVDNQRIKPTEKVFIEMYKISDKRIKKQQQRSFLDGLSITLFKLRLPITITRMSLGYSLRKRSAESSKGRAAKTAKYDDAEFDDVSDLVDDQTQPGEPPQPEKPQSEKPQPEKPKTEMYDEGALIDFNLFESNKEDDKPDDDDSFERQVNAGIIVAKNNKQLNNIAQTMMDTFNLLDPNGGHYIVRGVPILRVSAFIAKDLSIRPADTDVANLFDHHSWK